MIDFELDPHVHSIGIGMVIGVEGHLDFAIEVRHGLTTKIGSPPCGVARLANGVDSRQGFCGVFLDALFTHGHGRHHGVLIPMQRDAIRRSGELVRCPPQ
jgi:hypothetical protein